MILLKTTQSRFELMRDKSMKTQIPHFNCSSIVPETHFKIDIIGEHRKKSINNI